MKIIFVIQFFQKMLISKKSYFIISGIMSILINAPPFLKMISDKILNKMEIGAIPLLLFSWFLIVTFVFIMIDLITGVIASRKLGEKIQSHKWGTTTGKLFGLILYSSIAGVFIIIFPSNYLILSLLFTPIILTILKEFISIGENLEKVYNYKPYIYTIVDRLFDVIELKFYKTIDSHDFNKKDSENK